MIIIGVRIIVLEIVRNEFEFLEDVFSGHYKSEENPVTQVHIIRK